MPTEQTIPKSLILNGPAVEALVAVLDYLAEGHEPCPEGCGCAESTLRRVLAGQADKGPCLCPSFDMFSDSLAGVLDPPPNPECPYHGAAT